MMRAFSLARDVLAVTLPVVAALAIANALAWHDQRTRTLTMADVVLNRSEMTTDQLASAFKRLTAYDADQACSPESIELMRRVDLGSSLLQGLGYVANNRLVCSSLGESRAMDVGPPDYVSATGAIVRRGRTLPVAPETPLLLISEKGGYTGLVHPALVFSLTDALADFSAGIVNFESRETIIYSGPSAFDWSGVELSVEATSGELVLGDWLVVWRRSARWDQFSYATIPLAAVTAQFQATAGLWLGGGIAAGVLLLVLLRRVSASRSSLPMLLKAGLARNEIHTVYQPIVDMRTGRWVGAEVLARWRRPTGETISPDVFIPIAEKHGLIRSLTRQVMVRCAEELKSFVDLDPEFFVSVNITSTDLQDPTFKERLASECSARGIGHHRVHLEITERIEVDTVKEADALRALRADGFSVGIDDFGIGYSNLAYLDTLQPDYIKIDRLFVAGISSGAIGVAVINSVIALGVERGVTIIAEGVETEEQRRALIERGVALGQGWLFAKPMTSSEFANAFRRHGQGSHPDVLAKVA